MIVDENQHILGIVSMSDLMKFLVASFGSKIKILSLFEIQNFSFSYRIKPR